MKKFWLNFKSVIFWSIISAAFIGPGTVTTAAKAGASFGLALLWALLFSILGTVILQEAAARLSIASGKNIGQLLSGEHHRSRINIWIIAFSIFFGCAAYQAGNILGAVSGLLLFTTLQKSLLVLSIFIIGFLILLSANYKLITGFLGIIVAVMGFAFLFIALRTDVSFGGIVRNSIIPSLPPNSDLLLIGLIGTTIVPYNIFLGNGISHGQEINQMRIGLIIAILIGGIISMSILVVGTTIQGEFSFELLKQAMEERGGKIFGLLLGIGLFAAGISSSITSPFAAAVTFQSCFKDNESEWGIRSMKFRSVWIMVMLIGLGIGLMGLKVIPVIITAQAINGLLLPIVACYLLILVNKEAIMGTFKNGLGLNLISLIVIGVCFFVGLNNIFSVLSRWSLLSSLKGNISLMVIMAVGGMLVMAYHIIYKQNK